MPLIEFSKSLWTGIRPVIEILILWIVFFRILVFFEGTRAFQVLKGIVYLLIAFLVSQIFGLDTLNWLLTKLFAISIIALLIIFQPELRQGLARLGQQHLFAPDMAEADFILLLEDLVNATFKLSRLKCGCLIAIERVIKLKVYIESGVAIDSSFSPELVQSIFTTASPLHDGGIIIRGPRIVAASCLFPLSENPHFSKVAGTRHRAGLGLSEQTDAVVIIVSEETGEISVAVDGQFIPIDTQEQMLKILQNRLTHPKNFKNV